mmetsp:Transcript_101488/g.293638  ORF Transcript_101488/g.293638 Transcript_101488/m.293638 type:complete len:659 (+) Transcript_101488:66-2042(+)
MAPPGIGRGASPQASAPPRRLVVAFAAWPWALVLPLLLSTGRAWARGIVVPDPWTIDPNSLNYTWPWVYSYCVPCKEKVVGTCFFDGCYSWRGHSECHLTRCICAEGFCADEESSPGLGMCQPQVCKHGPRPLPFVPGTAVRIFHWLGGEPIFPKGTVDATDPDVLAWVINCLCRHSWIVIFAVMSILLTSVAFWHIQPPPKQHRSVQHPEDTDDARAFRLRALKNVPISSYDSVLIIERDKSDVTDTTTTFHKLYKKPRSVKLLSFVGIIIGLCVVGALLRDKNWSDTTERVHSLLDLAEENALELKRLSAKVYHTCLHLRRSLQHIRDNCKHDPIMSKAAPTTLNATAEYVGLVANLTDTLSALPKMVRSGRDLIDAHEGAGFWVPLAPVLIIALVSSLMISEALCATKLGKRSLVRRVDTFIRFAIVPYVIIITLITAFSLAGFTAASLFSSFCIDVDDNVLSLVQLFTDQRNLTDVYDLSRFYILGWGNTNPALSYAKLALQDISLIYDIYVQFESLVDTEEVLCPPLANIDVHKIVREARHILRKCSMLLQPANLYPFYNKIVREALCRDLVTSLANFPVFTVIIGLVVFPVSVVYTHSHLVDWAFWKDSQLAINGEEGGADVLDDSSEASSFESEEGKDDDKTEGVTLKCKS